jgi:hypothetical protein
MKSFSSACLLIIGYYGLIAVAAPVYAEMAEKSATSSKFTICSDQTYGLCALANCFVMDGLAYCQCDVMTGDSISTTNAFGDGENVCSVNAQGVGNGYMVST